MPCLMPHVPPSFSSHCSYHRHRLPPRYGRSRRAPSSSPPIPSSATSRLVKVQVSSYSFVSGCSFSRLGPSRTIPTPPAVPTTSRRPSCSPPCNLAIAPASASSRIQRESQDGEACSPAHRRDIIKKMFPGDLWTSFLDPGLEINLFKLITDTYSSRFKDFDDIEYGDIYRKWSICVRVEVIFRPNKYGDNISFILMDKNGAKIEANVCGLAEVERFNRILQPGGKYVIHRVKISSNMEEVEFRAIRHAYECYFNQQTIVESSVPIEFPVLPKHLMPFLDVYKRPNKTFVDIVGIVVHCCERERERVGMCNNYREAIFMDAWSNLIAVGIWGSQLIQNSYMWSTAEGGNPIVIATMLQKDIEFGDVNTSEHTKFAFNPTHHATRPLQDIRHKIISGAIDMSFVRRFLERRWAFCAIVLAKRDARYKKLK